MGEVTIDPEHVWVEELAAQPGRPEWGPVPILQAQRSLLQPTLEALGDPDPVQRRRAALLLGLLGMGEAVPVLDAARRDADREVRMQVGVSLCLLGDASGLPAARAALGEAPAWVRYYALTGLWRLGDARAEAALQAARAHLSPFLQDCVDQALAQPWEVPAAGGEAIADRGHAPADREDLWGQAADALISECDWWWHAGSYDQCIRSMEASLLFDPHNVEGYGNIAWLQWSMGRHGEAVSTYHRGIAANPLSWDAADELANYYRMRKQYDLAARYYELAARLGSPAIQRRSWGHVLEALGRYDEARAAWRQVLQLDPNDPIARRQLDRLGTGP
jgi:tetratricopeptide (TPR) repeat protein